MSRERSFTYWPGILSIPVVFPRAELLGNQSALRDLNIFRGAIILTSHFRDHADQIDDRVVVDLRVIRIDVGETKCSRIEAAATARRSPSQEHRIGAGKVEVGAVALANVIDQANVGAELEGVPAVGPSHVIHPVVDGNVKLGSEGCFG